MTDLPPAQPVPSCQAERPCDRLPCFQARLDAASGSHQVRRHAVLCAHHLGDTVYALASWARDQGLHGQVTVLAIDQPCPAHPSPAWNASGLAFGTIPISA